MSSGRQLQEFDLQTRPEQGPPRLAALREALALEGLDGFIIPRADAHQGEYVAPRDDRLAWLTGFTGSAGTCIVLADHAALFVDGRYRIQARHQVDTSAFSPVNWPEIQPGAWLREHAPDGAVIGYDPWLHTRDELHRLRKRLEGSTITLCAARNFVDAVWHGQPLAPSGKIRPHPIEMAGESADDKRVRLAAQLRQSGQSAAVITLPDSLCWLLNIRGEDIPRNPVVQAFAILHDDSGVTLYLEEERLEHALRAHLGPAVRLRPPQAFAADLRALSGPVRVDPATAPVAVGDALAEAGVEIAWASDPCILPKARKNPAEIKGAIAAHQRDAVALAEFLCWLEARITEVTSGTGTLTEIDVARKLEACRHATGQLQDISFESIVGSGPNGAIVHYRVSAESNRALRPGDLLLVDSGAQYPDGTTDVTRTIPVGPPEASERAAFTRVLQGMIALSRARWPRGLAGRDLDALARYPLWLAGQDYDHGTGHGVGAALSVHEGPQRISRKSDVALEPGMILSNEPGYYREGAFGIRIENLVVVREAAALPDGDARDMLHFETLTWAPIDRRLIEVEKLSAPERAWLDAYHAEARRRVGPLLSGAVGDWFVLATAPL